jgi:2-polyprenyl-3-methyl-5-hydroxy-6-metoxy-1,4-benzoquinol methylase
MTAREQASSASPGDWHSEQEEATEHSLAWGDQALDDDSAHTRVWWWGANEIFYNAHLVNIRALMRSSERFRLLDLGCGQGALTRELAAAFPNAEIVALDANRESLDRARSAGTPANVTWVEGMFGDARERGPFHVVVCSEVLEHVEHPDDLIATAASVLAPGGHLSLSTPSGWMWRRPGPSTVYHLLNSPVGPRLADQRTPSAVLERARNAWGFYRRVRLHPERHWREAVPYHPAVQPRVAAEMLDRGGFDVVLRTSSLWHFDEQLSVAHRATRALERRRPLRAAQRFFYGATLLEGLMNVIPPLRAFESRQILLARKRDR